MIHESPVTYRYQLPAKGVFNAPALISVGEALVEGPGNEFGFKPAIVLTTALPNSKAKIIFINDAEFADFAVEMLNRANFNALMNNAEFQKVLDKLRPLPSAA